MSKVAEYVWNERVMCRVAVVVVWFNPTEECVRNLDSYRSLVDRVLVVDNSSGNNSALLEGRDVDYIPFYANRGVGVALNVGVEFALKYPSCMLITMDQDSFFPDKVFELYLNGVERCASDASIAIFSPSLNASRSFPEIEERDFVITSGSFYTSNCLRVVGRFNEDLFIDEVDTEYCCRVRRLGYRMVALPLIEMQHKIGSPIVRRFVFIKVRARNHGYVRKYYMTRNRLWVASRYPEFVSGVWLVIIKDAIKVLLLEPDKRRRIMAMLYGFRDYRLGRLGVVPANFEF